MQNTDKKPTVTIITGVAGSGKTHYCVEKIKNKLRDTPIGRQLIFLTPRQATFQIEQLIYSGDVYGGTRLKIVGFERLAKNLAEKGNIPLGHIMSADLRMMIIREILQEREKENTKRKRIYTGGTNTTLVEILAVLFERLKQEKKIEALKKKANPNTSLGLKLSEISEIFDAYKEKCSQRELFDYPQILDKVTDAITNKPETFPQIEEIWVDGFSEFTPQQIDFLKALSKICLNINIALCLNTTHTASTPYFWQNTTGKTFAHLANYFQIREITIGEEKTSPRFKDAPALAFLENNWLSKCPSTDIPPNSDDIELHMVQSQYDEIVLAAREIKKFVQKGYRYRDCALLFRNIQSHQSLIRHIFRKYQIPFFLDTQHYVAFHPICEFILHLLKLPIFGWGKKDLFSLLRTGLTSCEDGHIDIAEDAIMRHSYSGKTFWEKSLWKNWQDIKNETILKSLEDIRDNVFHKILSQIPTNKVSGSDLYKYLVSMMQTFDVADKINTWSQEDVKNTGAVFNGTSPKMHNTILKSVYELLESFKECFGETSKTILEWLPIFETGLARMRDSAIPTTLDQVIIGSVDRTRTPDIKLAIIPGLNEGITPTPLPNNKLFIRSELKEIEELNLVQSTLDHHWQEEYLSYILFTRPSKKLILSYAITKDDQKLEPSHYIRRLRQLLGEKLPIQTDHAIIADNIVSECELNYSTTYTLKADISPEIVKKCHNGNITIPITGLEKYGACPFQFLAENVFRLQEWKEWGFTPDKTGTFLHNVLEQFQRECDASGKTWREMLADAEKWENIIDSHIEDIAQKTFLVPSSDENYMRKGGNSLVKCLASQIKQYLRQQKKYFETYQFSPTYSEFRIGPHTQSEDTEKRDNITWQIKCDSGDTVNIRARIDRIDVAEDGTFIVVDYKSSEHKYKKNENYSGQQLQLIAYLCALRDSNYTDKDKGITLTTPGGAFYIDLKSGSKEAPYQFTGVSDKKYLEEKGLIVTKGTQPKQFTFNKCSFPEVIEDNQNILQIQTSNILKGDFSPSPCNIKDACKKYCPASMFCRFDQRIMPERKPTPIVPIPIDTKTSKKAKKNAKGE